MTQVFQTASLGNAPAPLTNDHKALRDSCTYTHATISQRTLHTTAASAKTWRGSSAAAPKTCRQAGRQACTAGPEQQRRASLNRREAVQPQHALKDALDGRTQRGAPRSVTQAACHAGSERESIHTIRKAICRHGASRVIEGADPPGALATGHLWPGDARLQQGTSGPGARCGRDSVYLPVCHVNAQR